MQQVPDEDRSSERGADHGGKGYALTKRDVVGGALLAIVVVGALAGYFTFNHISKDSARMQFWTGFMFSFAALVVVVIQVAIYWQQADFMKQQVRIAKRALRLNEDMFYISERAYVELHGVRCLPFKVGERARLTFFVKNGGRTPAFRGKFATRSIMAPNEAQAGTEEILPWNVALVERDILAGTLVPLLGTSTETMTADMIAEWEANNSRLYIWLTLIYFDIKPEKRSITYAIDYSKILGYTLSPCGSEHGEEYRDD